MFTPTLPSNCSVKLGGHILTRDTTNARGLCRMCTATVYVCQTHSRGLVRSSAAARRLPRGAPSPGGHQANLNLPVLEHMHTQPPELLLYNMDVVIASCCVFIVCPQGVLHGFSMYVGRYHWDMAMAGAMLYVCFVIPIQITFGSTRPGPWLALDLALSLVFIGDILVNLNTGGWGLFCFVS